MRLTSAQKQLYNMEVFAGDSIGVICGTVLFDKIYDIDEMKRAIHEVYRINESLRTRISADGREISQYVTEYEPREIKVLRFDTKEEVHIFANQMARTPFDFFGNLCELDIIMSEKFCGVIYRLHHIISDGWTLALIASQFYKILNGETVEAFPYSAYIEEEAKYLQSKRATKDKEYFIEQYRKIEEPVYLFDTALTIGKSIRKSYIIDTEYASEIMKYIEKENTSAYTFFLTLINTYFSKMKNNAEKFFIGTTVLNRTTHTQRNTAGMFVNIVPFLAEMDVGNTFAANIRKTEEDIFSLFRHQKYNYSDMLSEISENRLFDVVFSYQNNTIYGDDFLSTWYHCGMQNESLQIHIDDRDSDGVFRIHYDYQTEKFSEDDIDTMHNRIVLLIADILSNENKPINKLNWLTNEERETILNTFNATETEYPRDKCIHELFEAQAEKTPDKVALVAVDKTLTYRELNEEANRIAHSLIEKGVGKGDIIGLMLPRRSYLLSALFGILKTGAAYLPIDMELPTERIEYMCKDTNAKLVVSEDNIYSLLVSENKANPNVEMTNEALCYCIYTSGSTGQPKGVMARHRNVVNYISRNEHNIFGKIIKEDFEAIVSISTCSFDIFVTETIATLVNGLRVVLADEQECRNQYALNRLLAGEKGEFLQTTPTKLKALTREPTQREFLKNVKAILLGGEAMEMSYLNELKELTNAKIYNIYGVTEVPIWSTFADTDTFTDAVTVGRPIANTQIYIVDKYLKPVPIGVMGELCIAGDSVSMGYLNKSELTAEKFVDNPFGEGKLYRTGDHAYWREDGNLVYIGRKDFQVKIRGLRIELGEIESVLQTVGGIERAVVVVRKDKEDRQLICAFYTGKEIPAKALRAAMGGRLPKYMLPHIFTHLEKMPMTASGKANRNALPEIDLENISTEAEYVAPETEREILLTECIADVLDLEKVGVLENFFDIGGDSLKAIELTAALEEKGYMVNVKDIFEATNIQDLAKKLISKTVTEETITYASVIPATAAQMRVYTAQMVKPDSTHYNVNYAFKTEIIDKERLERALNKLIERHESLRTHFESIKGVIHQVIDEKSSVKVEELPEGETNSFIKPFDLSKSPLIRVGCNEDTVVIDLHHIIVDGESMPVFFRELNELYMGRELNEPIQYGEFAVTDSYTEENEKYWLDVFRDKVSELSLPTDSPRGAVQSFKGSNHFELIEKSLHDRIEEKCKEKGLTPYAYYMACFSILLSKLSGSEDIIVGTPISGRKSRYLNTVGMFANTVAMRNRPHGSKTVAKLLKEIQNSSIQALDNQSYPFGELVRKLNIDANGRNPLFDVMLAYQSFEMTDITFGDKKVELIPLTASSSKCDISFSIMPRANDVVLMVEYCTDLYKEETIKKFINSFKLILTECLDEAKQIKDISALTREETEKVLHTFNDTEHTYSIPAKSTLYSLFESASEKNKDKVCINANDEEITFKDLKAYAERIDSKVRNLTDNEKSVIAVIAERSFEMYGAIYGIIRGGNVYLPIDPNYPQDRIDYILENSNAKAVITQDKFTHLAGNTPCIDATELLNSTEQPEVTECLATPEDTAYVIYTSGSTGNPKGAKISHKSAINRILWMHDFYPLEENDVILQKTPYTFDVSVWELFWWGITGRTLCASKPDEHFLPAKILDEVQKHSVTHLHFVPSVFDLFLTYLENNPDEQSKFNSVKYVFLSGEALTANHINRFYNIYDYNKVQLHNLYGPTECAVDVSYYACMPTDIDPVPIGKPIYNTQLYIVDKHLKPTPIGVVGELCIGGVNVGLGYLNNEQLTNEKFIPNPFGEGKLYKTGDLAYWREDGNIIYYGRIDSQVKLNGQRIELGEIEKVISEVSGIEAVTVMIKQNNGQDVLVAFCSGDETAVDDIIAHCESKLPQYMVPSKVQFIEKMPLNASGKLDRKALKNIEIVFDNTNIKEAPVGATEKMLCELFQKTLHIDFAGRNESFFNLGGTSLDMISILSENELKDISAAEFIANPTPAKLAKLFENADIAKMEYLEPLWSAPKSEKALVLFPFASGGAGAYAKLVESIKKSADNISIYFVRYLHSVEECEKAANEVEKALGKKNIYFYSHCVGSAVALQILNILEHNKNCSVKHFVAGGSIPAKKPSRWNSWNITPNFILRSILTKAGAPFDKLSRKELAEILKDFRRDTDFATQYYYKQSEKISCPTSLIISKNDYFTSNYEEAEILWKNYCENLEEIHYIEASSHYFQSDNSDTLAEILIDLFK